MPKKLHITYKFIRKVQHRILKGQEDDAKVNENI